MEQPYLRIGLATLALGIAASTLQVVNAETSEELKESSVETSRSSPARRDPTNERISQLRVPEGFQVSVFARDIGGPRMMAVAPHGTVFVTRREQGDVLALRDTTGDGRANQIRKVASGLEYINGIALHLSHLYLATDTEVLRAQLRQDGSLQKPQVIATLPDAGQHPNRTLAFGPDGMLYVSVGSTCNSCDEPNPESATLLRMNRNGQQRAIFARGLRNTIGFGWHPQTSELWGMDHGTDMRGDDFPREELNHIRQGNHYGWPFCIDEKQPDTLLTADPEGSSKEGFCPTIEAPVLTYQAHSSPLGMVFYNAGQFPADYRHDAFVAFRGSWNRKPATGYKVARVRFESGRPVQFEDFLTGFLSEDSTEQFGRPTGLAVANDGALLIAEDSNGMIYRVSRS